MKFSMLIKRQKYKIISKPEIIRYIVNGLFATMVHYTALVINLEILDMKSAGIANFSAAIIGILISFFGNRYFVFKTQQKKIINQFIMFYSMYLLIALFHGIVLLMWTDLYGFDYRIGFIIASILQFILSYFGNKLLIFKI